MSLEKKVTPHMLRHTTATNLLRNGCPIGFIKEILGHSDLMTTCRYYLGVLNEAETKRAHQNYSKLEDVLIDKQIARSGFENIASSQRDSYEHQLGLRGQP